MHDSPSTPNAIHSLKPIRLPLLFPTPPQSSNLRKRIQMYAPATTLESETRKRARKKLSLLLARAHELCSGSAALLMQQQQQQPPTRHFARAQVMCVYTCAIGLYRAVTMTFGYIVYYSARTHSRKHHPSAS